MKRGDAVKVEFSGTLQTRPMPGGLVRVSVDIAGWKVFAIVPTEACQKEER